MTPPKNAIYKWLQRATPEQKKAFAKAAKTSIAHLRHIATGRRGASAELAQLLAAASKTLHHRSLYLDQRDICKACGVCPLVEHPKAPKPKAAKATKSK